MRDFTLGALVMASGIVGLFFMKFWSKSRDRFFLFLALAFWILGLNWGCIAFVNKDEAQTVLYSLRLIAFGLIIIGIWDKNRPPSP